jgi:hypothetical protein
MCGLTVLLFLSEMKTHYFVDIEKLSLYYQGNGQSLVQELLIKMGHDAMFFLFYLFMSYDLFYIMRHGLRYLFLFQADHRC